MKKKLAISFGLVNIPVELNPVVRNNDTSFNMLHKKCGGRIKQQRRCPHCEEDVHMHDIVKGYQYTNDKYVTFSEEDFSNLQVESDKTIEIIAFVKLDEIDPIYFERSYYLTTKDKSKAFSLFKKALNDAGKVAIAKTFLGHKSYYVALRFGKNNILMNTLYFEEEINLEENVTEEEFTKAELDMATKLIDAMSDEFKPETFTDEYQTRIKDAINKKVQGEEITKPKEKKTQNIGDLMSALEQSIKKAK